MKILFGRFYILVVSDRLVNFMGKISGFDGKKSDKPMMGTAVFPCFIFLRNLTHPMTQQWLNHEKIHIRQNMETLCVAFVIAKLEFLFARIFLHYSKSDANRFESIEQEAYLNQHNRDYLKHRKIFSSFKYIFRKKKFYTDEKYHVVLSLKTV